MSSAENLETRVTALENQMAAVRADAAASRLLAGAVDRDVSEFKPKLVAYQKSLNALRETQLEQQQQLARLEGKVDDGFAKIDARFAKVDDRLDKMDARFVTLEHKVDNNHAEIKGLLHTLIGRTPPSTE